MLKTIIKLIIISSLYITAYAEDIKIDQSTNIKLNLILRDTGSHSLIISNHSKSSFAGLSPFYSRNSLVFIIFDEHGNIIKPIFISKINPAPKQTNLPVAKASAYKFRNFDYITGTGKVGYKLTKENIYRVIAVYRPKGLQGPSFSSNEALITIK